MTQTGGPIDHVLSVLPPGPADGTIAYLRPVPDNAPLGALDLLLAGANGMVRFDPAAGSFVPIFSGAVSTLDSAGNSALVVGLADRSVGVLEANGEGELALTVQTVPLPDLPSALDVQGEGSGMEVYVTVQGNESPEILTGSDFLSLATELPTALVTAETSALAGTQGLGLVAVLVTGALQEGGPPPSTPAFAEEGEALAAAALGQAASPGAPAPSVTVVSATSTPAPGQPQVFTLVTLAIGFNQKGDQEANEAVIAITDLDASAVDEVDLVSPPQPSNGRGYNVRGKPLRNDSPRLTEKRTTWCAVRWADLMAACCWAR